MVKLAIPQILFRPVLTALLAVLACGSYDTLKAGSISAYREEGGKVVFVNEPEAQYPPERTAELAAPSGALPDASTRQERNRSVFLNGFDQMIQAAALRHRVDPALVRAIVQVESNFNPFAVSSRGAMGLMQLVPATARRFGVKNTFDPKANLDGGVRYLKYLMTLFEEICVFRSPHTTPGKTPWIGTAACLRTRKHKTICAEFPNCIHWRLARGALSPPRWPAPWPRRKLTST